MRARAWALSLLSSTAVLVLGWQMGSQADVAGISATSATATASSGGASSAPATPARPDPAASTGSGTPTPTASAAVSGTFVGDAVSTRFGAVQVQITVADGGITDVTALSLTDRDPHSVSISNRAARVLRERVLQAQSAQVDGVSGATYTTDGYLTSVQSAIDKAGL